MTPSKLKEQLMAKLESIDEWSSTGEALIDIILEQSAALEEIEKFKQSDFCGQYSILAAKIAREALASTNAKLKALGCE